MVVAAFGVALPLSLRSQTAIYNYVGTQFTEQLGSRVAGVGDVNSDGVPDYAANSPFWNNDGTDSEGRVWIYSGTNGTVLYAFSGEDAGSDQLAQEIAGAGDVNADGFADVVIGGWGENSSSGTDSGAVIIRSGLDGSILHVFYGQQSFDFLGCSVDGAGDVNADGYADVVAGAFGVDVAGAAYVFSGVDGSVVHTHTGNGQYFLEAFGSSVAGCGDLDGDGQAEVLIGSHDSGSPGYAKVYSGADGSELYSYTAPTNGLFGSAVDGGQDADGDGVGDLLVGYPNTPLLGDGSGLVFLYSGADGSLLREFKGTLPAQYFGGTLGFAGDVDGDGRADLVGGSAPFIGPCGTTYIQVHSGASGALLFSMQGETHCDWFGGSVDGIGDVNGDGHSDMVVGIPGNQVPLGGCGKFRVVSGVPLSLSSDVHMLQLEQGGTQTLRTNAGAGQAGNLYLMLGSASGTGPGIPVDGLTLPLNLDSYLLHALTAPNTPPLSGSLGILSTSGVTLTQFTIPPGLSSSFAGLTLHHASAVIGAGPVVSFVTNAVPITLLASP